MKQKGRLSGSTEGPRFSMAAMFNRLRGREGVFSNSGGPRVIRGNREYLSALRAAHVAELEGKGFHWDESQLCYQRAETPGRVVRFGWDEITELSLDALVAEIDKRSRNGSGHPA